MRTVKPSETRCEMSWIVMPGQTNALGTIFGGQVMAWIDICAAIAAQRFARGHVVTAEMDELSFLSPIRQGDVVVLQAMVNFAGRTSMEVGVRVERENPMTGERAHTSSAYLTFVALDEEGCPRPVPALAPDTPDDLRRHREAQHRRAHRLAAREQIERMRSSP